MLRKDLGKQMQLLAAWSAVLAWHGAGGQRRVPGSTSPS